MEVQELMQTPLFVHKFGYEPDQGALNGELQPGSPAINEGEDAEWYINYINATYNLEGDWALQWKDINGNPRDNTPTIGAYEYEGLLGIGEELQYLNL